MAEEEHNSLKENHFLFHTKYYHQLQPGEFLLEWNFQDTGKAQSVTGNPKPGTETAESCFSSVDLDPLGNDQPRGLGELVTLFCTCAVCQEYSVRQEARGTTMILAPDTYRTEKHLFAGPLESDRYGHEPLDVRCCVEPVITRLPY